MKLRAALFTLAAAVGLSAAAATGCGLGDFPAISTVTSVRILASRADEPYAKPGDTVQVDVLAVDGRAVKTTPMHVYWLPFACENPPEDLYYLCFEQLVGGSDGGTSTTSTLPTFLSPGHDLTPFLVEGPSYAVQIPDDIISSHAPTSSGNESYGLTILFNVACAGHLEVLAQTALASKQQIPLGCFDENEKQLDATQYVIGYTRIFSYTDRTNQNPVIDHMIFQGATVDLIAGVTTATCGNSTQSNCPALSVDTSVPMSSWEVDPASLDENGQPRHEEIWVDYYATGGGGFDDDAKLLYDGDRGVITDSADKFYASPNAGQGALYAVVHDSRDGANWVSFPVVAQ
jgi:hypothetical protein